MSDLKQEYKFFQDHLDELLKTHPNEFVIVSNQEFKGFYPTFEKAFDAATDTMEIGTFLIQQCVSETVNSAKYFSPVLR